MPNIKSAKKRVKVIKTKTMRNKMVKTNVKTVIKSFDATLTAGDKAQAAAALSAAYKRIDQAAAKGILNKNLAARKKSQLAKAYGKMA
jgi:small subunit ribosomal protein S20